MGVFRKIGNAVGIKSGPGNAARDRRAQQDIERARQEGVQPDPYSQAGQAVQWDEAGMPIGQMPKGQYALDYQYEANRRAEQRRVALWGDAQNILRQGTDLMQAYRPGGSAALASGIYGQRASLYGTQAMNTEAPDLLIDWREQIRARAEKQRNKLNRNAQLISGFSSFNFLAGGTPTETEAPSEDSGQPGPGGGRSGSNITLPPLNTGNAVLGGESGGAAGVAAGGGAGATGGVAGVGGTGGQAGGGTGGMTVMRAMDAAAGAQGVGGYGAGGSNGGQVGGRGTGPSKAGGGQPEGGGGGVGGMAGGGSSAPLTQFTGREAASSAMAAAPGSGEITADLWAESPVRQQSTALMVSSAQSRLLEASGESSVLSKKGGILNNIPVLSNFT